MTRSTLRQQVVALMFWLTFLFPVAAVSAETLPTVMPPVVVTATRIEQSSFDLPITIDMIDATELREHKPTVNVSESLSAVPGILARSRETYAQEQQVTIRGFGARSQFGVRGIKLLADGIPTSTPDGQGGTGLFDLASAQRIEVLRGPFSALYGNHSGGVVQVFTEDGPEDEIAEATLYGGSYASLKTGFKLGGQSDRVNYIANLSRFRTNGYRKWSQASKYQGNAKLRFTIDPSSSWTLTTNYLDQPENLDPLGLTVSQVEQDRQQANPAALTFRTRRILSNAQAGAVYENNISRDDSLRATFYAGTRANEQYLAFENNGVSTFERDFHGTSLRWTRREHHRTLTVGGDYDRAQDLRQGFANDAGEKGALSREEINSTDQTGSYLQGEWDLGETTSLTTGLRYTRVRFESEDRFLSNGDGSGRASYSAWTPAVGVLWRATPHANLYANAGRSFETPTFIEIAFRSDGAPGLNFDLMPSKSNHYEAGIKTFLTHDLRLNLAVFRIDTGDEIVVSTNAGGRTTYQNAGDTRRHGIEIGINGRLGNTFSTSLAATWLDAVYVDNFLTCAGVTPPCRTSPIDGRVLVNSGNKIPGIPNYFLFGKLTWRHNGLGLNTALEALWNGRTYVDDINSTAADSYAAVNMSVGFARRIRDWRFSLFARIDNLLDKKYIGSVYVNDLNGRFFAPAPERNFAAGLTVNFSL